MSTPIVSDALNVFKITRIDKHLGREGNEFFSVFIEEIKQPVIVGQAELENPVRFRDCAVEQWQGQWLSDQEFAYPERDLNFEQVKELMVAPSEAEWKEFDSRLEDLFKAGPSG